MSEDTQGDLTPADKPSLLDYISDFLPFKLPSIPLPQTAKNLDKAAARLILSSADRFIGWSKRRAKVKDAQAEATVDLIRKGSNAVAERIDAGDRELAERAIIAAIGENIQAQRNRERIAEFASDELGLDPGSADATGEIDDDWLNVFSERASQVSKEQMQLLWGRVLAGEIRQPGSFRLRTLQALSVVDAEEAKLVHEHMNLVIDGTALYVGPENDFVSFGVLLELESIGVLQGVGGSMNLTFSVTSEQPTLCKLAGNHGIRIHSNKADTVALQDVCALTPFGKELYKLAKWEAFKEGLPEAVAKSLKKEGRIIELLKLTPTSNPTKFHFAVLRRLEPSLS